MAAPPPPPGPPGAPLPPGMPPMYPPGMDPAQMEQFPPRPVPDPGSFDMLHSQAKSVMALPNHFFDGLKVSFLRGVGSHLQVSHSINLGSQMQPDSYHFSPTYLGPKRISPAEGFPILMADVTTDGSMIAQAIHELSPALLVKAQGQTQGRQWLGYQMEGTYNGSDFTAGLKLVNINPLHERGILVFNYLQKVTKHLSLGGEFMVHKAGAESSGMSVAGQYQTDSWTAAATISPVGILTATYYHKINDKSLVSTDLDIDLSQQNATGNFGYQYNFTTSVFRGMISSSGIVAAVLEKQLAPAVSFSLCGMINHVEGKSRFGLGLTIGQ